MEERISPYALNAQEMDICISGSDGGKYCFVEGQQRTKAVMAISQDCEGITK